MVSPIGDNPAPGGGQLVPAFVAAQARNHRVLMETIDKSLEAAREARERAQAERAAQDKREAEVAAGEAERRKAAEELEEADARKLVERQNAEAESAAKLAELIEGERPFVKPGRVDLVG